MWGPLALLGLLLVLGLAAATGRGVCDSRDPKYSLRVPFTPPPPVAPPPTAIPRQRLPLGSQLTRRPGTGRSDR